MGYTRIVYPNPKPRIHILPSLSLIFFEPWEVLPQYLLSCRVLKNPKGNFYTSKRSGILVLMGVFTNPQNL
ncbi:hypothetical protein GFO_1258 [Christiangramia forsetii KT0803]|uniref:Uncharacterized protein n=1 Tax=Christiangramia forsetii (strain DSM 17595 / CGMCC 1.15422 / KT0803) TaxID=411154 RepID=A0M0T7_CHRFK|nr:hypothetical protein GFO_1258 [Christiangramia forsetii KT0803]